jgi:hypothetical protein
MRLLKVGLASASLLLFVSPALADPDTTSTPQQPDPNNRVICKEIEVTGSLLPGPRICHTKAEWDQISHESQQNLRDVQDNGTNMTPSH